MTLSPWTWAPLRGGDPDKRFSWWFRVRFYFYQRLGWWAMSHRRTCSYGGFFWRVWGWTIKRRERLVRANPPRPPRRFPTWFGV